jgi:hypothetical protein
VGDPGAPHALGRVALGRLVHAPAGLGKTRALIEIAEELTRAHGWLAGFVPRDVRGAGRELSERDFADRSGRAHPSCIEAGAAGAAVARLWRVVG